jgi:hypothetical protein
VAAGLAAAWPWLLPAVSWLLLAAAAAAWRLRLCLLPVLLAAAWHGTGPVAGAGWVGAWEAVGAGLGALEAAGAALAALEAAGAAQVAGGWVVVGAWGLAAMAGAAGAGGSEAVGAPGGPAAAAAAGWGAAA